MQWRRLALLQHLRQPRKMLHTCSSSLGVQFTDKFNILSAHPIISYILGWPGSDGIWSLQADYFPGRLRHVPSIDSALHAPLPLFLMHLSQFPYFLRLWRLQHLYKLLRRPRSHRAPLGRERKQRMALLLARASDDRRQVCRQLWWPVPCHSQRSCWREKS
jgi:hypothetical protein